jgi:L-ornithine Nalpha-acyltransferase
MTVVQKGRYRVRFANHPKDMEISQKLRHSMFRDRTDAQGSDRDQFDASAKHVLIEEMETGFLVCSFRLLHFSNGQDISHSYSAQYYDLSRLQKFTDPMVEMGRFCVDPSFQDADILRLAWGFLASFVRANEIEMLFGCSSFRGVEPKLYNDTFAFLGHRYLAPLDWRPTIKATKIHCFTQAPDLADPDFRRAMKEMPPLLRTYLAMGGRVSDHAVVDAELDTLHVFTGLMVKDIPPARVKILTSIFE